MAKLQNKPLADAEPLTNLLAHLQSLLQMAKQGEWENTGDIANFLVPALEAVQQPGLISDTAENRQKIRQILSLLPSAIEQCSMRQAQLAPLIKALIPNKDFSAEP